MLLSNEQAAATASSRVLDRLCWVVFMHAALALGLDVGPINRLWPENRMQGSTWKTKASSCLFRTPSPFACMPFISIILFGQLDSMYCI